MKAKIEPIIAKIICILWFVLAGIILIVKVILIGQYLNLIPAAFALIIALRLRRHCKNNETSKCGRLCIISLIVLGIAYCNLIGMVIFNQFKRNDPLTKYCYSFDIRYLENRFNHKYNKFPQRLPVNAQDCTLEFMPSVLQGSGFLCLSFKASDDVLQQYINQYSSETILPVFTISQYKGESYSEVLSNIEDYVDQENYSDSNGRGLEIYIPDEITAQYPDAEIYVISATIDWNHPHSFCFCCDRSAGLVIFTEC